MLSALLLSFTLGGVTIPDDMVVVGGQSLSEGLATGIVLSGTQPYCNQMVASLTYNATTFGMEVNATAFPLTPLIEFGGIESPRSGMANYISSINGTCVLVITDSQGGTAYDGLKKGTVPWTYFKKNLESGGSRQIVGGTPRKLRYRYVVEGEADNHGGTTEAAYIQDMIDWQADTTAQAILSSFTTGEVPLFMDPLSTWTATIIQCTGTCPPAGTSWIASAQYKVARMMPGKISIVNATSQLVTQSDGVHRTSVASRQEGATMGLADLDGYFPDGRTKHQPLWPQCAGFPDACGGAPVSRTGAVITIQMYVPVCPLVFGAAPYTGVSSSTHGFEYADSAGAGTISSVVSGGACVNHVQPITITLSADPTGHTSKEIRYAWTGTPGNNGGPTSGPRGDICDSNTAEWQGSSLKACTPTFSESVP